MRISCELVRGHELVIPWSHWPRELTCHQRIVRLGGLAGTLWVILESNVYFTGFVYDFTGFNEVYVGFMGVDRLSGAETMVFGIFTQSIAMHKECQVMLCFQILIDTL